MFSLLAPLLILTALKVIGSGLTNLHRRAWWTFYARDMKARMDAQRLEIGKRFLPVVTEFVQEFDNIRLDIITINN